MATGLLVVAVGPATRFLQYLPLEPKTYEATIRFGEATTTYDREGEVSFQGEVPGDLSGAALAQIGSYLGLIQQQPPMFSAVKIKGQPLYKLARKGEEVERASRTVHIAKFDLTVVDDRTMKAVIVCSGGTYVRSLAHDLGMSLGCGAHLVGLKRTQVGRFDLASAVPLDTVDAGHLLPLSEALSPMVMARLDARRVTQIREGRQIRIEEAENGVVALQEPDGSVFGIARVSGHIAQPECVIPAGVLDAPR
jgi:tRNA pseudouridine55 synthase